MNFFSGHQCCAQRRGGKNLIHRRSDLHGHVRCSACKWDFPPHVPVVNCLPLSPRTKHMDYIFLEMFLFFRPVLPTSRRGNHFIYEHELCFSFSCCAYQSGLIIHDCMAWPPNRTVQASPGVIPHPPSRGFRGTWVHAWGCLGTVAGTEVLHKHSMCPPTSPSIPCNGAGVT